MAARDAKASAAWTNEWMCRCTPSAGKRNAPSNSVEGEETFRPEGPEDYDAYTVFQILPISRRPVQNASPTTELPASPERWAAAQRGGPHDTPGNVARPTHGRASGPRPEWQTGPRKESGLQPAIAM